MQSPGTAQRIRSLVNSLVTRQVIPEHSRKTVESNIRQLFYAQAQTIQPEPPPFRLTNGVKVAVVVGTGITLGMNAGKKFAEVLEETEIFVPDDDDD